MKYVLSAIPCGSSPMVQPSALPGSFRGAAQLSASATRQAGLDPYLEVQDQLASLQQEVQELKEQLASAQAPVKRFRDNSCDEDAEGDYIQLDALLNFDQGSRPFSR